MRRHALGLSILEVVIAASILALTLAPLFWVLQVPPRPTVTASPFAPYVPALFVMFSCLFLYGAQIARRSNMGNIIIDLGLASMIGYGMYSAAILVGALSPQKAIAEPVSAAILGYIAFSAAMQKAWFEDEMVFILKNNIGTCVSTGWLLAQLWLRCPGSSLLLPLNVDWAFRGLRARADVEPCTAPNNRSGYTYKRP